MLYPHPRTFADHLANGLCALVVGCLFAFVGLNAASGCGQSGGTCIHATDLFGGSAPTQISMVDRR